MSSQHARINNSRDSQGEPLPEAGPSNAGDERSQASADKTISCTSCRRRKLKCDRKKPECSTCVRLRNECDYPTRRKNPGTRRRNMKELEARLAQVETQLVSDFKGGAATNIADGEPDYSDFTMNMSNLGDGGMDMFDVSGYAFAAAGASDARFLSQELISLGIQEPLPPDDVVDELHQIYFDKYHITMPIIHKPRYMASLSLPTHMRPPVCLRYAMWMEAASLVDKYRTYEDIFYQRARRYLEAAEMKGHGESFLTIQHAQAWYLVGVYEAKKTYFSRAWISVGRLARIVQMLGLHNLDAGEQPQGKKILPAPKDWIDLEERRRTFWAAFYADRWSSSGTGWPMIIKEDDIFTNLPSSEQSYVSGIPETTPSLAQSLTGEGTSNVSSFGGIILSSCLFGHNFEHLTKKGPDERPNDLAHGEYWKRHRKMDNVLLNTFMFLPDHLRMPNGARDFNVVFLHTNIHAASITLHQAAIKKAEKNGIDPGFIALSRARNLMAAEEIANIMRLVSHRDTASMSSWTGFCLYVAGGVFIQDLRGDRPSGQSLANLHFLQAAMKAIGNRHSITKHFGVQLELDMEGTGLMKSKRDLTNPGCVQATTVMDGLMPKEQSPNTSQRLHPFSENKPDGKSKVNPPRQRNTPILPLYGILPPGSTNGGVLATGVGFDVNAVICPLESEKQRQGQQTQFSSEDRSGFTVDNPSSASYPIGGSPFVADNSTPSDSSSAATMQYAYRPADANVISKPGSEYYTIGLEDFNMPPDWTLAQHPMEQTDLLDQSEGGLDGWREHLPMN